MNLFKNFIQGILKDLKLDQVKPTLRKALEFRIGEIVDEQVSQALQETLSQEDWDFYQDYKERHPEASEEQAAQVLFDSNPDVKERLEETLVSTYQDIMIRGQAVTETIENLEE